MHVREIKEKIKENERKEERERKRHLTSMIKRNLRND